MFYRVIYCTVLSLQRRSSVYSGAVAVFICHHCMSPDIVSPSMTVSVSRSLDSTVLRHQTPMPVTTPRSLRIQIRGPEASPHSFHGASSTWNSHYPVNRLRQQGRRSFLIPVNPVNCRHRQNSKIFWR